MTLVVLGAGAVAVSLALDVRPRANRVEGDRAVNEGALDLTDIRAQNSPTLVRNPRKPRKLAVANRIDSPRFSCGLHLSRDGGVRWESLPIPTPRGEEPKCFAPDVAYGVDGALYVSFATLKGNGNVPNAVWLSRLEGRSLTRPRKLLGPLSFQVRLVADPARAGRLYLTWLKASGVGLYQFTDTGNPVSFMRSDDGGESWRDPTTISGGSRERVVAPSLAVGPDQDLNVLYLDLGDDRLDYSGAHGGRGGPPYPGPWKLVNTRSEDGGRTWEETVVAEDLTPIERFVVFLPAFPSIASDPDSGRLYASFHDGDLGDPDIRLWTSSDQGRSWNGPRRVNDTPPRDGRAQYLPKLAVAPNGRLDILYYDRRRDPKDQRNDVSLQSSFDEGKTFSKHLRLSRRSFDSRIGFGNERALPDLGSRLALISADTGALGVWTDTSAGTSVSRKQDLAAGPVAFSRPAPLGGLVKRALLYGGFALALAGLACCVSAPRRRRRVRTP